MKQLLRLARTEILEQRRQPWMMALLGLSYVGFSGLFVVSFVMIDVLARSPETNGMKQQLATFGMEWDSFLKTAAGFAATISFGYLQIVVAFMCTAIVLHERTCGTMPFLRLAPITPFRLLTGKVLGAMAIPTALHFVVVGASNLVLGQLETFAPYAWQLGGSSAWWVAFAIGTPASALMVGALGTVISAGSRDTRAATQVTNIMINLLGLGFAAALVTALPNGPLLQIGFALGFLAAAVALLAIGAALISTDTTS